MPIAVTIQCAMLTGFLLADSLARASDVMPPGLYEVMTETAMPHLEENLRYTTTRERRCLAHPDLPSAFPILSHPALTGCTLKDKRRNGDAISYRLVCNSDSGTSGAARWHVGERRVTGTLNVKLGGKNMTFRQRLTAMRVGDCELGAAGPPPTSPAARD